MSKKSVRLLVVDDQKAYYDMLREYAEMYSHEFDLKCEHASNSEEALDKVGSFIPSIVLLDAHLDDGGAFELLSDISNKAVHIVMTSAHNTQGLSDAAIENGADAFIHKSENPDDVEFIMTRLALMGEEADKIIN